MTVYLRALLELHSPEPDDPLRPSRPTRLELAPFQRDGYERARRSPSVTVGRSMRTVRDRQDGDRTRVYRGAHPGGRRLCARHHFLRSSPSAGVSGSTRRSYGEVISFQELASDEQLTPEARNRHRHLDNRKDSFRQSSSMRRMRCERGDELESSDGAAAGWHAQAGRVADGDVIKNRLWDLKNLANAVRPL